MRVRPSPEPAGPTARAARTVGTCRAGRPPGSVDGMPAARWPHLDNLRTALVAWVIGGHALLGYSHVGGWAYDEVHEVTFAPGFELVLLALLGPSGLFVIGMFFFIAGLFTERAIARHGPRGYLHDRALRLGLPWLVSAVVVWPASVWVAYTAAGRHVSPWWVLTHRDPLLDSGSLWFALVLLVYSAAFALWRMRRPAPAAPTRPLTGAHLVAAVAAVAVTSFVVRLAFPARGGQILDLHLWQWPQCLGLFALGVVAARHGWARHVPDGVRRGCGIATVGTLVALPALALASGLSDLVRDVGPYLGGWHWQALATATVEGVLVVAGSVWLVGLAERRLAGAGPRARRWVGAAFAAFVIQGPVLMVLASAMRPFPLPAEVKAPVVAAVAIAVCFRLGRHVPFLAARPPAPAPHVVDYGGPEDGQTVVLVHGLGGSHLNWDLLAPLLARHARVLALDLPGFGLSAPRHGAATVRGNVATLARVAAEHGPVVVVGNSMGGLVGILLAARRPALVRGLVLLNPALAAPSRVLGSPADAARLAVYAVPGLGEYLRRRRRHRIGARATLDETLRLCGVDPAALPADLVERSVAVVARQSDVAGMDRAFLSASRSLAWTLARARAYRAAMASIRVPVLLMHGDADRLVPVGAARATARRFPAWRYVELTGAGHVPQLQMPETVAGQIVGWLATLQEPSPTAAG